MTELQLYVAPARPRHRYNVEVTNSLTGETRTVTWVAPDDESAAWMELTVTANELTVTTPTHEIVQYTDMKPRETGES